MPAGCGGGGADPQEVSGRVTFQKQPLESGTIEFVPTAPEGTGAGAMVRGGQYTVGRESGLLPGSYRVKIAAAALRIDRDEAPSFSGSGDAGRPRAANHVEIPKKYNVDTVLTAEVAAEGKQTIDFDLD